MFRLLTDEDFNGDILRGLLARVPGLDVVRAQDIGLSGAPDPDVLARAAAEGRILLTHDRKTMVGHACARVADGEVMPGVLLISQRAAIGQAIHDLETVLACS